MTKTPIGRILQEDAGLSEDRLAEALNLQKEKGALLGEILIGLKYIRREDLAKALSRQFDLPYINRLSDDINTELLGKVPIQFAKQNEVIPLKRDGRYIDIAISDPMNLDALDDVRLILDAPVKTVIANGPDIIDTINRLYDRSTTAAEQMIDDMEEDDLGIIAEELKEPEDILDITDEAPIIKLINSLMFQAIKDRASDIHIEAFERELVVRFRIDGVLYNIISPPKRFQPSIISRVKVMAGLNIAEKRLPQDGRISIKIAGRDIDIRVSTVPTSFGERVVMRLLDKTTILLGLEEVGLDDDDLDHVNRLISRSSGIILVTGPTGSGKTTTLYAALSKINTADKNIITVEDPVEYQLKGIGQIHVNPKIDLTFANGLRSILRQDPDIIMVGEIRDVLTADIAIQASLTGHLVFSTLHTNDSSGAITRLIDMGVEPFLVSSSVIAIIAQRLVRLICDECKENYKPTERELAEIGFKHDHIQGDGLYRGRGCARCMNTGYRGRTGIYELMIVDDSVRARIMEGVDSATIKKVAQKGGMTTLRDDGAKKVLEGLTTTSEVMRVTQEEIVGE